MGVHVLAFRQNCLGIKRDAHMLSMTNMYSLGTLLFLGIKDLCGYSLGFLGGSVKQEYPTSFSLMISTCTHMSSIVTMWRSCLGQIYHY